MSAPGVARPVRVLVACDKFKGSATSLEVAHALAAGFASGVVADVVPVADGGDGTLDVADALGYERHRVVVTGPYGEPVAAEFALDPRTATAVIETAEACGVRLVTSRDGRLRSELDATSATSAGVGELVLAALDSGASRIVLGLGGTATSDGGLGLACALGAKFSDRGGRQITRSEELGEVADIALDGVDPRLAHTEFTVATDVTNPLCGPEGAAVVYGPQKGLREEQVRDVDRALARFAGVVERGTGAAGRASTPGAGAAGGIGFMCAAFLGAVYASGADLLLDMLDFDGRLALADIVITGEGRLDRQTLSGKVPAVVAQRARTRGLPVVAVCGQNDLAEEREVRAPFTAVHALTDLQPDVSRCLREPLPVLRDIGKIITRAL
nr:glycerate kinase [Kocuria rhizophila]